jgi:hypothetical protein
LVEDETPKSAAMPKEAVKDLYAWAEGVSASAAGRKEK